MKFDDLDEIWSESVVGFDWFAFEIAVISIALVISLRCLLFPLYYGAFEDQACAADSIFS